MQVHAVFDTGGTISRDDRYPNTLDRGWRLEDKAPQAWPFRHHPQHGARLAGKRVYAGVHRQQAGPKTAAHRVPKSQRLARAAPAAPAQSDALGLVAEARRWLGTNPMHRRSLWCAAFMNFMLERVGLKGTGADLARSLASAGRRVSGPQVGAIAVMARRGGEHVGLVSGIEPKGNPIIISGNHRRTVAEAVYPRGRVYAWVMPQ